MNPSRLQELIARFLDRAATAEELAELDGQLSTNPLAATQLAESARIASLLADRLSGRERQAQCAELLRSKLQEVDRSASQANAAKWAQVPPPHPPTDPTPHRTPVLGFLAHLSKRVPGGEVTVGGLLLLVIVAAFWGLSQAILYPRLGGEDLTAKSEIGNLKSEIRNLKSVAVATIRGTDDVQWSSAEMSNLKSQIEKGKRLQIESGFVELELNQGTTLLIEGPAEWQIDGENAATLKRGKLVAKVPQQAIGFALETPTAKIVDLGTEFGVEVDQSEQAHVVVLEGEVQVASGNARERTGARRLHAGEALAVGAGDAAQVPVAFDPSRFQRTMRSAKIPATGGNQRYAQRMLADKPIAYLRFDRVVKDKVLDESGHGHHATLMGSLRIVAGRAGLGQAAEFHGHEDCALIADHARLRPGKEMTVEVWLRQAKISPGPTLLIDKGSQAGGWAIGVGDGSALQAPAQPGRVFFASGGPDKVWHDAFVVDDQWHHVASVCDGKQVWTVVDGVASEARPIAKPLVAAAAPLQIGVGAGLPGWVGTLDEVAIYDRALAIETLREHSSFK